MPGIVDVPELSRVRSISIRVEGDEFNVAATRPLSLTPGDPRHLVVHVVEGEPLDLVLFVPRGTSGFQLRSGNRRLAAVTGGRPHSSCGSTVIQKPTPHQDWLTVFPTTGSVRCP